MSWFVRPNQEKEAETELGQNVGGMFWSKDCDQVCRWGCSNGIVRTRAKNDSILIYPSEKAIRRNRLSILLNHYTQYGGILSQHLLSHRYDYFPMAPRKDLIVANTSLSKKVKFNFLFILT